MKGYYRFETGALVKTTEAYGLKKGKLISIFYI